ncbi:MAG: YdcH family protein [Pseudomonadota bacterium]
MRAPIGERALSLLGRHASLARRKRRLEAEIEREQRRPAPCSLTLKTLKRQKLALKDAIAKLGQPIGAQIRA